MAHSDWILPRAESGCHRVFHPDRQSAEGHRIALELWIQATGHTRPDYRVVAFRCKNCGGYHVARRKAKDRTKAPARLFAHSFNPCDEPEAAGIIPDASPTDGALDGPRPWL
ncbi:hypothetical protein OJF2_73030 [Aquisphaera giovannonii]|uniref:Uncharacterized protein n=1 Tax=Aquisphaera giovannonii TaxID=406548 RepID=A0A5B9WDU5_9BACT|nr:hypothetical protein [Aquisphaera giovannonii]QEH38697.1 hypothetical protein OJF2_73030 [Aquisphaera giovannonii]